MYSLINAVVLGRTIGAQWTVVDLEGYPVKEIFSEFNKIFLTLSHPDSLSDLYLDMDVLRQDYSGYEGTLSSLFTALGNAALPMVDALPNTTVKYMKYALGKQSGYSASPCLIGQELPLNFPVASMTDLEINRITLTGLTTDMTLLHTHCLVTVNGYVHWTEADAEKTYVQDGAKTMNIANNNHFGLLSFVDIGELTKIRITEEMIASQGDGIPLNERIYINLPGVDLTNKSYILVLGGYLVFPKQGVFWQNGDFSFALDINQINFFERFVESRQHLDLSAFNLTVGPDSQNAALAAELMSDFCIKKYLTHNQSFLVLIDTPELTRNRIYLKKFNVPGRFVSYQDPSYPLIVGYGRIAEYWKTQENNRWAVSIQDGIARHYILSSVNQENLVILNEAEFPVDTYRVSEGYLLQLGGYNTGAL